MYFVLTLINHGAQGPKSSKLEFTDSEKTAASSDHLMRLKGDEKKSGATDLVVKQSERQCQTGSKIR